MRANRERMKVKKAGRKFFGDADAGNFRTTIKYSVLMPITAVENTMAVGFNVQLKKNAPQAYQNACCSPLRKQISSQSIIS